MPNRKIPADLVALRPFLKKNNIPISSTTADRMRRDPTFPVGFRLRPNVTFYSESELEQFILDKRIVAAGDLSERVVR